MSGPHNTQSGGDEILVLLPESAVVAEEAFRGQRAITVSGERLLEVMRALRDRGGFRYLIDVTALDFHPRSPRFQVVYHLWCHDRNSLLRVKVWAEGDPPSVSSVTSVWSTANWHERECYDLFGVVFDGHPDLRRILLPESWEGHPLRKDYPTEGPDWDLD